MTKRKNDNLIQAIPPSTFKGSIGEWAAQLQANDLWDGQGQIGSVFISKSDYQDILELCEQESEELLTQEE